METGDLMRQEAKTFDVLSAKHSVDAVEGCVDV
jgi:hypothetical protein